VTTVTLRGGASFIDRCGLVRRTGERVTTANSDRSWGWQTWCMTDELDRSRLQERIHILDGILDALERTDEINHVVRGGLNRIEAREILQAKPFSYSEVVANHILDLTVSRQTVIGIQELRREREQAADRLTELD
jgi:DNA gyrase/topoisomerase IV subunit A